MIPSKGKDEKTDEFFCLFSYVQLRTARQSSKRDRLSKKKRPLDAAIKTLDSTPCTRSRKDFDWPGAPDPEENSAAEKRKHSAKLKKTLKFNCAKVNCGLTQLSASVV